MSAPSPSRYLVTGGLGYVGAWISSRLAARGHELFVLSRRAASADPGFPCTLISADVAGLTAAALADLLPERLDGVVHAASVNEAADPGYAREALAVNAFGTRNLLEALRLRAGNAAPPLLYLSTFHVYGRSEGYITEQCPAAPLSDYALTHFFAEEYCRMAGRLHGFPCVVLRLTNGYGAPASPGSVKWHLLLNDLCRSAVERGELRLRSDPATPRDFVWLGDVAAVAEALFSRPDLAGRTFNLASGRSVSIGEAAGLAARAASRFLGHDVPVIFERHGGGAGKLTVDNEALRSALGYRFQDRMEEEILAILRCLRP